MKRFSIIIAGLLLALSALADDARTLYRQGRYAEAADAASKAVKRTPRDGNANFFLGASLYKTGRGDKAVAPLKQAESRGVAEASQILAEYALEQYRVDDAETHLDRWAETLKKGKKNIPDEHAALTSRMIMLRNMLGRVERIEIVDTLHVDSALFFEHYRLSPQAGRILAPDVISGLGGETGTRLGTGYMPENNSEILWAAADADRRFSLYGADILDDGTMDHPAPLEDELGQGGNAMFPFLMSDGMTLYFASDGENSLGGLDIFMTRRTDEGFFVPQNMGMPYNSPDNDFLLAIDEGTGLGWWASDRNHIPGKVTIYIFMPSPMRRNAAPDDPNLGALARLSNISLTQNPKTDYKALLAERLPEETADTHKSTGRTRFVLDMGNGKTYTSLSDFKNDSARSAMLEYLAAEALLRKQIAAEEALREQYRSGNKNVSDSILESEKQTAALRTRIDGLRNSAIRLENNAPR